MAGAGRLSRFLWRSGSSTFLVTLVQGKSERLYSWNTMAKPSGTPRTIWSGNRTLPFIGCNRPARIFSNVVLPQPGPLSTRFRRRRLRTLRLRSQDSPPNSRFRASRPKALSRDYAAERPRDRCGSKNWRPRGDYRRGGQAERAAVFRGGATGMKAPRQSQEMGSFGPRGLRII